MGVDGILSVTPYYNKPTQEGLYQHYKAIATKVALPIVVYSVQGRTGVNVETATLARLADIENIVGVKEASGNISQMARGVHDVPETFTVLSGDDSITIPLIALGGRGVISVASNEIPAEMTALTQAALAGEFARARTIQRQWLPLMEVNFVESNPIPVKAAMAMMGLLEPMWRLPMCAPAPQTQRKSKRCSKPAASPSECACALRSNELFDAQAHAVYRTRFRFVPAFQRRAERGAVRAAEPDASTPSGWRVNAWVKKGVLVGFRMGAVWICPSIARASRCSIKPRGP